MAKKKNSRQHKDEFIRLYKEGMSIRQIATQYNIDKKSISRLIKEEIELRPKSNANGLEEKFYELYQQGYNFRQIAQTYNTTDSTVSRLLRKHYNIEKATKKYEHLVEDFKREYKNGKSLEEISKIYNVNRTTILNYISEEKVESRTYSEARREYATDEHYFDELNENKAYKLGMIFSMAGLYYNNIIGLKIGTDKKDLIFKAVEDISNKNEASLEKNTEGSCVTLKLHSSILYDKLIEFGFDEGKINIEKEFRKYFFDGFFRGRLKVRFRAIYIGTQQQKYENMVKDYLLNDLNIDSNSIRTNKNGIEIEKMSELSKIITKHPNIKDRIISYSKNSNKETKKWNSFINKY